MDGLMPERLRDVFEDTFEDRGRMRMTPLWFAPYSGRSSHRTQGGEG